MERIIRNMEKDYKKLEMVAEMLQMMSPNNATYKVEDVYLDFGQDWMWTTICRYGFRECQVLSPREWKEIMIAETPQELAKIAEEIRNDKYFGDK